MEPVADTVVLKSLYTLGEFVRCFKRCFLKKTREGKTIEFYFLQD